MERAVFAAAAHKWRQDSVLLVMLNTSAPLPTNCKPGDDSDEHSESTSAYSFISLMCEPLIWKKNLPMWSLPCYC